MRRATRTGTKDEPPPTGAATVVERTGVRALRATVTLTTLAVCAALLPAATASAAGLEDTVHTAGRVLESGGTWRHAWPGVYFEGRFDGTAVGVVLDDATGDYDVAVDGIFGDDTEKAVIQLQTMFGYTVDALVGDGTRALIDAQIGYGWNAKAPDAAAKALASQGKK